jgi:hypothetical protein
MFISQLEVPLMTQATEPVVMWTYSRPVQYSFMAHNLVPQLLVLTAVVELQSVYDEDETNNCRLSQTPNLNINDVSIGNVLVTQEKGTNEPLSCPDDPAAGHL